MSWVFVLDIQRRLPAAYHQDLKVALLDVAMEALNAFSEPIYVRSAFCGTVSSNTDDALVSNTSVCLMQVRRLAMRLFSIVQLIGRGDCAASTACKAMSLSQSADQQ